MKIEEIEANLKSQKPLKFKNKSEFKDLDELIKFTCSANKNNETYFVHNNRKQCENGRLRGIGDIYRITQHYLPNISLKEIVDKLSKMDISQSYCCTTNQDVFYIRANNVRNYCNKHNPKIRLKNFKKVQIES